VASEENLRKIGRSHRALEWKEVDVKLPRFKVEFEVELSKLLQSVGITDAFTSAADFSLITDSYRLLFQPVFLLHTLT
jgi:serine protease inhibitor